MQQPFPIFMHIEHTGGTTLQDVVLRQYGRAHVRMIYYRNSRVEHFIALSEADRARYYALLGHLYYGIHRHIPAPHTTYLSMLRQPADRVVSSYYYMGRQTHAIGRSIAEGRLSLDDFIRQRATENNLQMARIVGGTDDDIQKYRITLPNDALEIAQAHIEQHFALVGLVERYDETLLMMQRARLAKARDVFTAQHHRQTSARG